ncbi:hypothetical protein P5V15_002404 [Pogonomyrmex californicus]
MKICRKPVAMVLLLLIHLLTLQIGDAGRNHTNVSSAKNDSKIILEEVIISGSGNDTRVIANAVAEDVSSLDGEILSLLSKREKRGGGHSIQTSLNSDRDDQDAAQSRIDLNEEAELEMLNRVIAKYEPQRIASKKTKRRIGSNGTHDAHDKVTGPLADLENTYAEVLRNISQKAPELTVSNPDVTLNPYLSQAIKQLKQVYIPEATIHPTIDVGTQKSRSNVDSSLLSSTLKSKKPKKLPKKYLQLDRTATTPQFSAEESKSDEKTVSSDESSTPGGYFKETNGKAKLKNGSRPPVSASNVYSDSTEKPKSRREWNVQNFTIRVPPFTSQLDNRNDNSITDVNNLKNLNNVNAQFPPRYVVPRPFSMSQSTNSPVIANIANVSYRKPSSSPAGFAHQRQIVHSSANVLPLVLPTDLFTPLPVRHYSPIKRVNHLNPEGNSATLSVSTEASPPTSPVGEKTTLADNGALYTGVIGTTSPLVTVNSQRSYGSSDYYAITESPAEQTVTRANFATTYIPSQTSPSHIVQRQKDLQNAHKNEFLPRIVTYNNPNNEKSSENPGIALYNQFSSLYSANIPNVFNAPKAITQDFKQPVQPSQQQVSNLQLPYATLKPLTPILSKVRPIAPSTSVPYYDSRLFIPQNVDEKLDKNDKKIVEAKEQSRKDADETEKEHNDDNDDLKNYRTQINPEVYNVYKASNKQREREEQREEEEEEEEEENEDRYPQQSRNYEYQDKSREQDKDDRSSKSSEKYENVRYEDDEDDEEEVDETKEEERVSVEKSKDEDNNDHRHQNNKYEYNSDNSEEERDDSYYDRKKYNKPKDRRDKYDYGSDTEHRFEGRNKYFESLYNNDETRERDKEHRNHADKKKLASDNHYKKNRQDRRYKEPEDESADEDKSFAQPSKDHRTYRQDERYKKEQNHDEDDKSKYHNHQASPRRDSLRQEYAREKYSESNPKHVRKEYNHQRVKDDNRDKEEPRDHVHGETQEHAHKHEEHHEKKDGGGGKNHKFEEGGGAEHDEEHHGHEGEKGEKGYKVWHEHEKAEKGHHDKEHASKHYDEKGGEEKKHDEEGGYHEEHHHGEGGKKIAEFGEKGEHKKGHSTHGEHSVHKKDEYEKKTEFFDEFHEDGGVEKHGEHHHEHEGKKGGHEKKGHHDGSDHEEKYGKEEKHEKGGHHHEHKGHKHDEGHDHHYDHHQKHGKKEGHEHGKKWSFKKGDGGGDHGGGGHKHNR